MIKPWLFDIFNYPGSTDPEKWDAEYCQQLYDWHMESWVLAEEVGFEGLFFSEHHYTPYAVSPSPNLLVAAVAQRTSRMKLGVMANIVPMHNPRRLAEEFAMLDYLSHGRLEIGLGRGIDEREYAREGIPMAETRRRFEDGLRLIEEMMTQPIFAHDSEYARFQETSLWPQPITWPAPWIVGTSPETVTWCANNGYRLATAFQPTSAIRGVNDTYKAAAEKAGSPSGPDQIMVLRNVFVAETDEQARAIAEPALNHMFGLFKEAVVFHDLENIPEGYSTEFYQAYFRPFQGEEVNWEILVDLGIFVVGSPATVRDQLISQAHEIGTSNFLLWGSFGTLSREDTLNSYRLLGQEVLPALRNETIEVNA